MPKKTRRAASPLWLLPLILLGLPLALLAYESNRTGLSYKDVVTRIMRQAREGDHLPVAPETLKGDPITYFSPRPIGDTPDEKSTIAHVLICDLDSDGLKDVLFCDVLHRRIRWIRQSPIDVYTERAVGDEVAGPAHVEVSDVDQDGDLDILVSAMGMILPNNDRIGKVIVMENDGEENFRTHVIAERIARVNDLRGGDLDGDGDIDLVAGQFGYDQGEIRWMRNDGDWQFESIILLSLSGTIHTPIVDLDNDGDLDIVALVSQEWEEVYAFENDGQGNFQTRLLYGVADDDYGSSGIGISDVDGDGDLDIIWANGDAFVATDYHPMPSHGVQWLENTGDLRFEFHRLGDFPGAYDPCGADIDNDGDTDIVSVSAFNYWDRPDAQSVMCWENMGDGTFIGHDVASEPTHLVTVDAADMNEDGKVDLVTGSMNLYPPFDRIARITLWINERQGGETP